MSLFEIRELCKGFVRDKRRFWAVDHVSLDIDRGQCMGLVGESGCGKSTLALLVSGLMKKDAGKIRFMGTDISSPRQMKTLRHNLQMIFQNPTDSFDPRYTLMESVKQGIRFFPNANRAEINTLAQEALAYVGLRPAYFDLPVSRLSGGECQRAAIARAIISKPRFIICDEPTSALDVSVQAQIVHLLHRLVQEKETALLFITHDLALASSICDRISVMYQGQIVESGPGEKILDRPMHPYTKMLVSCVLPPGLGQGYQLPDCERVRAQPIDGCIFYEYCPGPGLECASQRPALKKIQGSFDRMAACFLSPGRGC